MSGGIPDYPDRGPGMDLHETTIAISEITGIPLDRLDAFVLLTVENGGVLAVHTPLDPLLRRRVLAKALALVDAKTGGGS
jgi:hypothetical protein